MKWKRIFLLTLAFVVFGTASAFAKDAFQWYKAKNVRVFVNDQELNTNGLLISGGTLDNTTLLPVRELAGTLQALVNWDSKTQSVTIHKPNVHITLLEEQKDGSLAFFGQVPHKVKSNFYLFTQIDNITTKVHSFKIALVDPDEKNVHEYEEILPEQKESVWYLKKLNVEFKELGDYTVRVFMKVNENDEYSLVSERVIKSIAQ